MPLLNYIAKFQPMPKRFMVWDKDNHEFLTIRDAYPKCQLSEEERNSATLKLQDLIALFSEYLYYDNSDNYVVCQSTNLFDKDGKEIFEGGIVENRFIYKFGLVYYDEDVAGWRILYRDGTWDDLYYVKADIVVAGHVLLNPELLEEKDV